MKNLASRFLALVLVLAFASSLRAAGPDEDYIRIYNLIQQGDTFDQRGERAQAAEMYIQANKALQKLQGAYPFWNEAAVRFRLNYLTEKLQGLASAAPTERKPGPGTAPATKTVTSAETQEELKQLRATVQRLTDSRIAAEAKLKEALSTAPPPVDPRDLARAQEQAALLQKELDLVRASLEQEKAAAAANRKTLDEWSQKTSSPSETKRVQQLEQERDSLKVRLEKADKLAAERPARILRAEERVAVLEKSTAELQASLKEEHRKVEKLIVLQTTVPESELEPIRNLRQERDDLRKKLDQANREIEALKVRPKSALPSPAAPTAFRTVPAVAANEFNFQVEPAAPEKKKRSELPPGAGPLVADAERAFLARRFDEAEKKYLQVLRQDENNILLLGNVAAVQLQLGHLDDAEKNAGKAIRLDPEDAYALRLLGMIRFQQNRYDDALEALKKSAKLDPKSAETQNHLGITLGQKGENGPAEAALRKALELQPTYAEAHFNLALVYAGEKPPFLELARWHYRKARGLGYPVNAAIEAELKEKP